MKVLLAPIEANHIELALNDITSYYNANVHAGNRNISLEEINKCIHTLENILKDYNLTIEGIKTN